MSDQETVYTSKGEEDEVLIEDVGFMTPENVRQFKFQYSSADDITDGLEKKNKTSTYVSKTGSKGRIGYTSFTVTYPDGTTSNNIAVRDCIIQYREVLNKKVEPGKSETDYATSYVCIGINSTIIDNMTKSAAKPGNIKIVLPTNVKEESGYHWFTVNLDSLSLDKCVIAVLKGDDEADEFNISIKDVLSTEKKSAVADILFSNGASQTTQSTTIMLDLTNGSFRLKLTPRQVWMTKFTDIMGPQIVLTGRKKEMALTNAGSIADDSMSALAARISKLRTK